MEDRETARMRKYGGSKTTRIMMATVPHVTSGLGQKISGRWIFVDTSVLCNIVISSIVHHVRHDDGLLEKGPKHVVHLLSPYTAIKFLLCFDLPTLYQL